MLYRYPLWKNLLILAVVLLFGLLALPNLYGEDPAVQVSPIDRKVNVDETTLDRVKEALAGANIDAKSVALEGDRLLARFRDTEVQIKAQDVIKVALGRGYIVALNLAPSTPNWLRSIGAAPMYLGLDLRGGVHFLMEVDMAAAIQKRAKTYAADFRTMMRKDKVRYTSILPQPNGSVVVKFRKPEERARAVALIEDEYPNLKVDEDDVDGAYVMTTSLTARFAREIRKNALVQNITTLRKRVNELGVAEPVIQQQGEERIVVQLPGVQDTARAKEILGATATLDFHLVDTKHDVDDAVRGRVPPGSRIYYERDGRPQLLLKRLIITGDRIVDAAQTVDGQSGTPAVSVTLDGQGARRMDNTTKENVGKPMAVVYIESKTETKVVDGKIVKEKRKVEEVISVANIRERFGKRFQVTGLSSDEAHNLALLLRAGSLAAPMEIIEERTVGPSLGQDNINKGFNSVLIGCVLVLIFMAVYYKVFGLVADLALTVNLVLIVGLLSMLQATLTLPGIAGIVLTVGMAVDANVLIFERIREELRAGVTVQAAINSGYDKAFSTIMDANVTTLIAAVLLFSFGTGPIKGFAVTLCLGIITSMFTAIMGTRAVINLLYGGKRVKHLPI
jgi:preprotein translocase subunit SecD